MFHLLFYFHISHKVQCFIFDCSIDVTCVVNLIVFIVSFWHIDAHFRYMLLLVCFYCFICCFLISNFYLLFYLLSFCFIDDSGIGQRDFSHSINSSICSQYFLSLNLVCTSQFLTQNPTFFLFSSSFVCLSVYVTPGFHRGMLVVNRRLRLHILPPVTIFGLALGHWSAAFFSYSLFISSPQHVLYQTVRV